MAGTRSRYAVSSSEANSAAEMSTALPRRDVISTVSRSSLTFSKSGKSCLRASLAVIDIKTSSIYGTRIWYHSARLERAYSRLINRSEERRVGKEGGTGRLTEHRKGEKNDD